MKKLLCLLLTLTLLAAALAGCSSGAKKAAGTTAAETTAAAATATASETAAPAAATDAAASDTITVTDHNGDTVTLPREVKRVVVCDIYPLPSVISVFLGSAEKLVGIHPVSMSAAKNGLLGQMYPEILKADTSFMQGDQLNMEALLALKPDVVFYNDTSVKLGAALKNAGLPAVAVSATKWKYDILETYNQWIDLLSQVFPNQNKSTAVADYSAKMLKTVQERTKGIPAAEKKKVLFLFKYDDKQMITSGRNFFGQNWCDDVNAVNAAGGMEQDNANAVINMEQVYEWNPDVIFITNFTPTQPDDLYNNKIGSDDWSGVRAVQNKQVYKMPLGTYRTYTPGVDTPVTLLWLAQQVYPEKFSDLSLSKTVLDYYKSVYGATLTDAQVDAMFHPSASAASGVQK